MKLLLPTPSKRLNEVTGFLLLALGLLTLFSLVSYHPSDPSWDTATGAINPKNLAGYAGSYVADVMWQAFGLAALLFPMAAFLLGWKWIRSESIDSPSIKIFGYALLLGSVCAALGQASGFQIFGVPAGGLLGAGLGGALIAVLNRTGAAVLILTALIVSVYLVSTFTLSKLAAWFAGPISAIAPFLTRIGAWFQERRKKSLQKMADEAKANAQNRMARPKIAAEVSADMLGPATSRRFETPSLPFDPPVADEPEPLPLPVAISDPAEIPICPLDEPRNQRPIPQRVAPAPVSAAVASHTFHLPSTELLNEPQARTEYDEQELKNTAVRIKSKFEEFNVLGSVVQINPGPVVTTFEFKPEAGIKYSRITTLTEDLCLGLQAESILIERIPGKPTVGIEVPNTRREVISLRQILESEEFPNSASRLTISLGKDINGRIKVAALDSMPHLLIAGSTGSGKSVMINSLIMSILYKSTPDEVRMIMVDPKRLELGLYEGIPHLLTPVITDPRKATNALRNAVLEMERRLRLLAEQGVRNIDQYNKKIRKLQEEPRSLFEEEDAPPTPVEELRPLPYILILIDELADLMMLEGRNVEESVTRLAQMARAVGMHLVLATQRPSVDVITGLIKANFPARISFRVATRVDSRTILDVMGSEHLLGKGDMLFLPPGSSRLIRVHGAFVTETEINRVVDFWKEQAVPEYDQSLPDRPALRRRARQTWNRAPASRIRCTRKRCAWCSKWARRRPRRCSAACAWAMDAPRGFST